MFLLYEGNNISASGKADLTPLQVCNNAHRIQSFAEVTRRIDLSAKVTGSTLKMKHEKYESSAGSKTPQELKATKRQIKCAELAGFKCKVSKNREMVPDIGT